MPNKWCQWHAQLRFEYWVLDRPQSKTVGFCDLLGTLYAPVSKYHLLISPVFFFYFVCMYIILTFKKISLGVLSHSQLLMVAKKHQSERCLSLLFESKTTTTTTKWCKPRIHFLNHFFPPKQNLKLSNSNMYTDEV